MDKKLKLLKISNSDKYNEVELEKSSIFLENLQDFILSLNLGKIQKDLYEYNGKNYDVKTFYLLFYEDCKEEYEIKKRDIKDFDDGETIRYKNNKIELLIIFLLNKIKLIFFCNKELRKEVFNSLSKFVNLEQ